MSEHGRSLLSIGASVGLDGGGGDEGGKSKEDQSCMMLVLVFMIVESEDVDGCITSSSLLAIGSELERSLQSFDRVGDSKSEIERALRLDGVGEAGGSAKTDRDLVDRLFAGAGDGVNSEITFSGSSEPDWQFRLELFGVDGSTPVSAFERTGDVWKARKKAPNEPLAKGDDCAKIGIPGVNLFGEVCDLFGVLGGSCEEVEGGISCSCSSKGSDVAEELIERLTLRCPPKRSRPFVLLFFFFFASCSFSSASDSFLVGGTGGGTPFAQSGTTYGPLRIGAEAKLVERNKGRGCVGAGAVAGGFARWPPLKVPSARIRSPPQPVFIGTPFSSSILGGLLDGGFDLFSGVLSPLEPLRTSLSFLFLC